jgi:HYR domain-containing protein
MRRLLLCALFLLLGVAGWAASGFGQTGLVLLEETSTDTTATTTNTTSTDTTTTTSSTDTTTTTTLPQTTTTTPVDNPPSFSNVPPNISVEANGPSGSAVNYTLPTAVDDQDGPVPVTCNPESGSLFPLGDSTVTCTATDSVGNPGQATFTVTVQDTTPPNLVTPAPHSIYATSALGVSDSDPGVIAFVNAVSAADIVDPQPVVGSDLHSFLPIGATYIRFFARDFSGNDTTREVPLTVLPMPPAGTPPLPVAEVARPPANVANLSIKPLDGALRLTWQTSAGVDHVVVTRSTTGGGAEEVVYSGNAESYTDRGLDNGVEYRYVVKSVGVGGTRSAGVAIVGVPRRDMLRSPKDSAQLKKPPRLVWAFAEADYYNVQLLRNGVRIFAAWPTKASLTLKKTWKYQGRKYTLSAGLYEWYVWPGFGARKDADYGTLLGGRSFSIRR